MGKENEESLAANQRTVLYGRLRCFSCAVVPYLFLGYVSSRRRCARRVRELEQAPLDRRLQWYSMGLLSRSLLSNFESPVLEESASRNLNDSDLHAVVFCVEYSEVEQLKPYCKLWSKSLCSCMSRPYAISYNFSRKHDP
jgi:hypothetical protein